MLFFFSGYFYKSKTTSLGKNIGKRALGLLVPFAVYALIFWAIGTLYLALTNQAPFLEALGCLRNFFIGAIWNRDNQGWFNWDYYSLGKRYFYLADFRFLLALFFASLLFFLIIDKVLKKTPFADNGFPIRLDDESAFGQISVETASGRSLYFWEKDIFDSFVLSRKGKVDAILIENDLDFRSGNPILASGIRCYLMSFAYHFKKAGFKCAIKAS